MTAAAKKSTAPTPQKIGRVKAFLLTRLAEGVEKYSELRQMYVDATGNKAGWTASYKIVEELVETGFLKIEGERANKKVIVQGQMNLDPYWKAYAYYFDKNGKAKKIPLARHLNQKDSSSTNGATSTTPIKGSLAGSISLSPPSIPVKAVKAQKSTTAPLNPRFDELIGTIAKNSQRMIEVVDEILQPYIPDEDERKLQVWPFLQTILDYSKTDTVR